MTGGQRAGRLGSVLLALVALALVGGGVVLWSDRAPAGSATGAEPGGASSAASGTPTPRAAVPARSRPGAPVRVTIPALGVDAPVDPISAPGGTLVPPGDAARLGWWAGGARPGDARGSVLVAGHTVHTGGGALDDLEELRRGDVVRVRTTRGTQAYQVTSVRVPSKTMVAAEARRLFAQDVPGRLVLVTCEDWDGTRYRSNVVVLATPTR